MHDPSRPITITKHKTAMEAAALVAQDYFPGWEIVGAGSKGFTLAAGSDEIYISKLDDDHWSAWYSKDGYEDAKCFGSFEPLIDWLRDGIANLPTENHS
ncbi:hypothetical protein H6F46_11960 [Limnothrix sp. FACHB-1083]|uniref:hypothetical protein n=1 Tax=unclassified Limnothrix TaxID=2632864 RepID=UPI00168137DD|nr:MULTISPECIES: hypothetical protein [unclassified Limnothrix]MBD2161405.1 hypothetical protein [Limnothrix sp. FACHB-1083]MBD2192083.1 hypothetical protein [Limnothrix sp. FACHB-1088]